MYTKKAKESGTGSVIEPEKYSQRKLNMMKSSSRKLLRWGTLTKGSHPGAYYMNVRCVETTCVGEIVICVGVMNEMCAMLMLMS